MLMLSMTVVDYYNFLHFDLEFEVPIPAMKIIEYIDNS